MRVETPQGFPFFLTVYHQLKGSARNNNRAVLPGQIERLHGLLTKDEMQLPLFGASAADRQHIRRRVNPLHLKPALQIGNQQSARAAADVERRAGVLLDNPLKEGMVWPRLFFGK